MVHCWCGYKVTGQAHIAKFMPHFDGPYTIIHANPACSVYTLNIPNMPHNTCLMFYSSLLHPSILNDPTCFPNHQLICPSPVVNESGITKWEVQNIINKQQHGCRMQYLMR